MRSRSILLAVGLGFGSQASGGLQPDLEERISASIVKVRVVNETRRVATGSAVSVGAGVLVTSCHGLRRARVIQILARGAQPAVKRVVHDIEHDVCLLETTEAIPPIEVAREGDELKVGDTVAAFGFAGPDLHCSEGTVKALHPYEDGEVIQTDATFASGESGGALVDQDGKLIGILTFYAQGRGDFYFAVPVRWVRELLRRAVVAAPTGRQPELSFWERGDRERPTFLQAAAREHAQDWGGLKDVASQWILQEARNPQAWIALGKAHHSLGHSTAAIEALHKAVQLDPRQPAGWYYLGAAYREIGDLEGLQRALGRLDSLSPKIAKALRDGQPME